MASDPSTLILTSLADGPKHGYALQQDIAAVAGARPGPGTLYGAIGRLEARGLIAPADQDDASARRRPYRLTAAVRGVAVGDAAPRTAFAGGAA